MKFPDIQLKHGLIAIAMMTSAPWAHAVCYKVTGIGTLTQHIPQEVANMGFTASPWGGVFNSAAARIQFGVISIGTGTISLAPPGTVLASANLNFLDSALSTPYAANQIVFKCAVEDAGSLYEMYALQGDSTFYGEYAVNDVEDGYATPAANIAYRITNTKTGQRYINTWRERKLDSTDYITMGSYIYIPASMFGNAIFELIKTNDNGSGAIASRNAFNNIASPQGFVALKGPGMNTNLVVSAAAKAAPPSPLNTSAVWSMKNGSTTVIYGNTCKVKDFDQTVKLPPISVSELSSGNTSTNTFNVSLECDNGALSGTDTNFAKPPVAMGFLVTQASALSYAQSLGLKNSSGGISHLLDDNYGVSGVASGVGIRIYSLSGSGPHSVLNLLSSNGTTGTGNAAGWYGFTALLDDQSGTVSSGGKTYGGAFLASLEHLPGQSITAGSVSAQAQIFVSLQ